MAKYKEMTGGVVPVEALYDLEEAEERIAKLEAECEAASSLIGLLRLAAKGKLAADGNYSPYRRYREARDIAHPVPEELRQHLSPYGESE